MKCVQGSDGIANCVNLDQMAPQFDLGLHCLPGPIESKYGTVKPV